MSNRELIERLRHVAAVYYDGERTCDEAADALEAHEWVPIADAPDEWKSWDSVNVLVAGGYSDPAYHDIVCGWAWADKNLAFYPCKPTHLKPLDLPKAGV